MVCVPVEQEQIVSISPLQLQAKLEKESVTLVDVRELSEYNEGHIAGALLKPTSQLTSEDLSFLLNCDNLVIYCRSGKRSRNVAEKLISMGKSTVYELEGGVLAWQSHSLPVTL